MSDIQIPNLPPATDLTGSEQLEIVQAGVSVRATIAQIITDANVPTASSTLPGMDGGASAGVEVTYSRGDHIHPTDTTRYAASNPANYVTATQVTAALGPYALIDSQAFTGTPSMPTGATGVTQTAADSSTKLATTAFVKAQGYAPTSSLGTMSVQNANAVAIIGGSINSTTVGATVASTGAFTTLSAVTSANFTTAGTVTINPTTLGHVDNTAVGATTPSTGAFTNLSASGAVSGVGFTNLLSTYAKIDSQAFTGTPSLPTGTTGITQATADSTTKLATTAFVKAQGYQTVAALGTMSTQNANAVAITGGTINGTSVGATTPSTGAFTNLSASGTVSGAGFTALLAPYATTASLGTMSTQNANAVAITGGAINGTTIGATTAAAGTFTNLTATGTVSGAGFTTLLTPYALVNSQVFTGTPSLPTGTIGVTQAAATNNTTLATTAYVKSQNYLTANQTITLSGDVTGSGAAAIAATVVQLQGRPLSASLPATGNLMGWNGTTWGPVAAGAAAAGGTNTQIQYNNGGVLGGISQNGSGTVVMTTNSTAVVHQNTLGVTGAAAANDAAFTLNKSASAQKNIIYGQTATSLRWSVTLGDVTAEGGSNAGSDFNISRYTDAGGALDSPLKIVRSTGVATFAQALFSANHTVTGAAGNNAAVIINKAAAGFYSGIETQTNGSRRWLMMPGDNTAEGGSNAGSDFLINRYSDTAVFIDTSFKIVRSTGQATFASPAKFPSNAVNANTNPGGLDGITIEGATGALGIASTRAGLLRWRAAFGSTTAESGSNTGSDFILSRYADNGTSIDAPFSISRATGVATFANALISGNHTVNGPASTDAVLTLNKPASGFQSIIYGQKAGVNRWAVSLGNSTAESSNAGSDFYVNRYNDAGTYIDSPLWVNRLTAQANFSGAIITTAGIATLAPPAGDAAIYLAKSGSAKTNLIVGQTGASNRWFMAMGDNTAESGGNAGSNFALSRFNDAGAYIDTPFFINRNDATVGFSSTVTANAFKASGPYALQVTGLEVGSGPTSYTQYPAICNPSYGSMNIYCQHIPGTVVQWALSIASAGTFSFDGSGNGKAPGTWVSLSDLRVKTDIKEIKSALEKVGRLTGCTYERTDLHNLDGTRSMHAGLIAQDIQAVLPEAVFEDKTPDGKIFGEDEPGRLSYATNGVVALLVNAVKELTARVEALEAAAAPAPAKTRRSR